MDSTQIRQAIGSTYDLLSAAYERVIVPVYRPIAKRMLQYIDLRPGWQVLDAGTGTGLVALLGAPRVGKDGRMIGVDASEKMLELARGKAAQFGFTQCEFRIGDLEALEFPDAMFNAILSQFAIHYTDISKSLSQFFRLLQPNGKLILHIWPLDSSAPSRTMYDVLSDYRVTQANGALASLRAQGERSLRFRQTYASPDAFTAALQGAGFAKVETHIEEHPTRVANVDAFLDIALASPLLHAEISALSDESRESYMRAAHAALSAFETPNGFEWVYRAMAAIAQKA